jgi:hypothetical protein
MSIWNWLILKRKGKKNWKNEYLTKANFGSHVFEHFRISCSLGSFSRPTQTKQKNK